VRGIATNLHTQRLDQIGISTNGQRFADFIARVDTRHHDNGNVVVSINFANLAQQLKTVHNGHHHIGQNQINIVVGIGQDFKRFGTRVAHSDRVGAVAKLHNTSELEQLEHESETESSKVSNEPFETQYHG
jgi:hypothetical protein